MNRLIFVILGLGLLLRLIGINQSLWYDEAISFLAAKNLDLWTFTTSYPLGDFHPPGFFAILWISIRIFGENEFGARLPSIIFGLATIWFTYQIGLKWFNKRVAIGAALLLAILPLHIYYSQEARMYSMSTFAVVFCFWALVKLIKKERWGVVLYAISLVLVFYSDYLAYLIIPAQMLYLIFFERLMIKSYFGGLVLGSLSIAPWLLVFPQQLQYGQSTAQNVPGWRDVVGGSSLKDLGLIISKFIIGRVSFDNKTIYGIIILGIGLFYSVIGLFGLLKIKKEKILLLFWIVIPVSLALVISFFVPVLAYFRLLIIVPAVILVLAVGLDQLSRRLYILFLGILVLINLTFFGYYLSEPRFQKEDWKGLANLTQSYNPKTTILIFHNSNLPSPYIVYDPGRVMALGGIRKFPSQTKEDIADLSLIQEKQTILVPEYLVDISDPNRLLTNEIEKLGFKVKQTHNIPSLGLVYEYTR